MFGKPSVTYQVPSKRYVHHFSDVITLYYFVCLFVPLPYSTCFFLFSSLLPSSAPFLPSSAPFLPSQPLRLFFILLLSLSFQFQRSCSFLTGYGQLDASYLYYLYTNLLGLALQ